MKERGWDSLDFIVITGDAYVDHPSFGTAIISRVLEAEGFKVGIIAQPNFKDAEDFKRLGKPRLGFLINSGAVDSMVNNYSVFKHRRRVDDYAPGGVYGKRPDRAVIVYANRAREAYKDVPIIIGGLEASLRRLGHYDYWQDKVRRSILLDAKADLLIYGMGEKTIVEVAQALDSGIDIKDITWINGTCVKVKETDATLLPSFEEIEKDKEKYAQSFRMQYQAKEALAEKYQNFYVLQNPPQEPLNTAELDRVYELPYEREYHPIYEKDCGIKALSEVKFSLVSSRGCFGGCAFCALTYHQGRRVTGRSHQSLIREAKLLIKKKDFKGYIHDVGGPTANFRGPSCNNLDCKKRDCMYPTVCKNMKVDHSDYISLLRKLRSLEGVKKVFIRSGIRYDYVMQDKDRTFIRELCEHHVSGTLKVAPEHVSERVLGYMRKPSKEVFLSFAREYQRMNEKLGKKQYLIPYLISSHPGSTLDDAIELALFLKDYGFVPDQVQDFYPTPGTLATTMFYTELDPFTMEKVYVPKTMEEKKMQRALIHFKKPENRELVIKALKKQDREDLIEVLLNGRSSKNTYRKPKRSR